MLQARITSGLRKSLALLGSLTVLSLLMTLYFLLLKFTINCALVETAVKISFGQIVSFVAAFYLLLFPLLFFTRGDS